jgi:chromosome partitioning protein
MNSFLDTFYFTPMSTLIAIANQKGGVAKTTTCLNLGHAIAEQGRKVLLCDLDPQSSLTISLGLDVRDLAATIYDVLLETKPGITIKDIIRPTAMTNVHVAPASIDLSKAEMDLFSEMNRERAFKDALRPVLEDYDFILIDCPPSLGLLTTNALAAADAVLIPLQSDYLAMRGAELLLATINKVRRKLNGSMGNVVSGVGGAVVHELTLRARGGGVRPLRIRPRRGGERSSRHPATSSSWTTAWGGGGAREWKFCSARVAA